LLSTGWFQEQI